MARATQSPAIITQPAHPSSVTDTAKRHRDELNGASASTALDSVGSATKRRAVAQDIIYRIVLSSRQVGKVIGKVGCRIQKIRDDTKATIKIADAATRQEDRIIVISSKDRNDHITEAENALLRISSLILMDDDTNANTLQVDVGNATANMIKFLITGSQAGSLIGVAGQNMEKLRKTSGATITVFDANQLSLCASTVESDRIVQITGDVPVVLKAVQEIGCHLRDNPPLHMISISPSYSYSMNIHPAQPYEYHQFLHDHDHLHHHHQQQPYAFPVQPYYGYPTPADYVTMEMMISESMVGGLIGRCGSNISRIRSESGAMIKVHGGKGEQKHRHVQFAGHAQQVALAKQRVDEYIYSQFVQQASAAYQPE